MITKTVVLLVLSVPLVACSGQRTGTAADQAQTSASTELAAASQPGLLEDSSLPAGSVVPGGAVDVLRREGWRIEPMQAADSSGDSRFESTG